MNPPRPAPRQPARITFIGGPLNRRTGTTRNLAQHRDANGLPVDHHRAIDLILASKRLDGVMPSLYALGRDHRSYEWLPAMDGDVRTRRIKALMERAAQHPDLAHDIGKQIRAIEAGAA